MEIRKAHKDEIEALARIVLSCRNEMTYLTPLGGEHVEPIARDIAGRHEDVWLAEEEGRLLGFLTIRRSRTNGWETLEKLYVDPSAQARGIGTALLDKAKELRPDGLQLWVFQKNEGARRFYEHRGFRLVKLTDGADNMEHEPDALYAWP
jgi:GNAT superfamily N-acetyltransferase